MQLVKSMYSTSVPHTLAYTFDRRADFIKDEFQRVGLSAATQKYSFSVGNTVRLATRPKAVADLITEPYWSKCLCCFFITSCLWERSHGHRCILD